MKIKGVVDRIEEGKAVVVFPGGLEILMSAALLPAEAMEGSALAVEITADHEGTERRKREVVELQERLKNSRGSKP